MKDWRILLWLIGVVWVGYVFVGYPLLLAVVARLRQIRPVKRDDFFPAVSVLISARNEEKDIEWKVQETLGWDYPAERLEVWVASDASDDHTDEILKGIKDPRFHFVRMDKRGGKNRAINRLAQLAHGDLLFFSDANSHIDAGCLRRVVRHFADDGVGCVTGNSNTNVEQEPVAGTGTAVYWGHEMVIRRLENEFGSVLVCDGAIFCIRRSLYEPCIPELANDLELPLHIGRAGYWLLHEPTAQVKEKDTDSPSEEFTRRRRICAQGALGMWKLRDTLRGVRGWQFFSHKFLRWLLAAPFFLVFVSSAMLSGQLFFTALFGLQLVFWSAALVGLMISVIRRGRAPRVLSAPVYFLVSIAGALVGVFDACSGRRFDIWESPALSRGIEGVAFERVKG